MRWVGLRRFGRKARRLDVQERDGVAWDVVGGIGRDIPEFYFRCEDSLLATPLILDLCILADVVSRIQYKTAEMEEWSSFHPIMSILSYLIKVRASHIACQPYEGP